MEVVGGGYELVEVVLAAAPLTAVPLDEEGYPPPGSDSGSPGPAEQGAYPVPGD